MFPSIKITLYSQPNRDGSYSVALRATYLRTVRYFGLNIQCQQQQWSKDFDRLKKNHPDYIRQNERIQMYEERAKEFLFELERRREVFTFAKIEEYVFGSSRVSSNWNIYDWICNLEAEFKTNDQVGTAAIYKDTANMVRHFKPSHTMADIDINWLRSFEKYLRSRGCKNGGVSVYMRTLRAACNKAIKAKIQPKDWYPFQECSLTHLKSEKREIALTLPQIKMIEAVPLKEGRQSKARDYFMFSFYNRGMNLADIARIIKTSADGDRLDYKRKKTKKDYSVKISDKSKMIAERYDSTSLYLFPILDEKTDTEHKKMVRIESAAGWVNKELKVIAKLVGIDDNIVFYTARHTYATALKSKNVPIRVIQEALGHKDIRTTENYLKQFDHSVVDDADQLLDM